jgi:hypothetical protein
MVSLPLPPVKPPQAAAAGEAAVLPRARRKRRPPAGTYLPADATLPGRAERRTAWRLAAVPAAAALVSLTPVLAGHANLLQAPPWALAAVLVAVIQLVYAAWMVNAPDWVSARVQMVVCAAAATIYAMLMTWTMIVPVNYPLLLGLGEVRRAAPFWCGLMFVLMGAATWFCGRASAKWRKSLTAGSEE